MPEAQARCGTSEEFTRWIAYYQLDPWGGERLDFHMARVLSMLYNAHRGHRDMAKGPKEFLPEWGRNNDDQSLEEMLIVMQMWGAFGAAKP